MVNFTSLRALLFINLAIFASAAVIPRVPAGTQFVTGVCSADSDCAKGCCGFNTGKCAGPVIAQERDGGCGFGNTSPNNIAAIAIQGPNAEAAPGVNNAAGPKSGGAGAAAPVVALAPVSPAPAATITKGTQFVTGVCTSDADCAEGCCGFNTGKCAGPVIAQERDGGCGFGNTSPNNIAAIAIQGPKAEAAPGVNNAAGPKAGGAAAAPAAAAPAAAAPAKTGSGKPPGTQFITGVCGADSDCASGCCNAKTALCAARLVAEEGAGCGFGSKRSVPATMMARSRVNRVRL